MKRIIIDADPGVDDAAAILLALASPELSVEAITTVYGNGRVEQSTRNALIILESAGRGDIPVYQGVSKPLMRPPLTAHEVHGNDALGDAGLPAPRGTARRQHAVRALVDRVMANPGEISLLAIGPLTNVALALSVEPRMATALKELILMGGAVLTWGNSSEVATFNLYNDPEAVAIVYQSGAPVVQAGLDVCRKTTFNDAQLEQIRQAGTRTTDLLSRITAQRIAYYSSAGWLRGGGVQYNDVPAMAYAIDPGLFDVREYLVRIPTHDELTKAQTVADLGYLRQAPPNAKVLMDVDAARLTDMFTARVTGYKVPDHAEGVTAE